MKQFLLFLASFILLTAVNFAQQAEETMDPTAATYYNKAVLAMKAEQYDNAVALLDSSLLYSKDYRVYFQKGNALMKLQKAAEAKSAYTEAVTKNPAFDRGYYSLAGACALLNDFEGAIANYNKVIEVTKDEKLKNDSKQAIADTKKYQAVELYNQGNTAYKGGKYDEAVALYDKSLAITNDSRTQYQKGLALSKLEKTNDAINAFKASVAVADSFDLAYVAMAGAYSSLKKYPEAIANYEKAQKVTKNDALKESLKEALSKTYMSAGSDAVKAKKYDAALEAYQKSNEISESDIAYLSMAKVYVEKKQYEKANAALDKASEIKKNVSEGAIAYYRGVMALDKKENAKAAEQFKIALNDPSYKKAAAAQLDYLKKVADAGKK